MNREELRKEFEKFRKNKKFKEWKYCVARATPLSENDIKNFCFHWDWYAKWLEQKIIDERERILKVIDEEIDKVIKACEVGVTKQVILLQELKRKVTA